MSRLTTGTAASSSPRRSLSWPIQNGDRLSSNEHNVPLADHLLQARDDALRLIEAQRGCRNLDRVQGRIGIGV